jgi:hypothetical protein
MAGSTWYFVNSSTFERWIVYLQINLIVEPFVNFWFRQNCWNIFTSNFIHILSSEMSKIVIFTGPNHFSLFWILVYHCNSSTKCNIFITFQKESSSPQLFENCLRVAFGLIHLQVQIDNYIRTLLTFKQYKMFNLPLKFKFFTNTRLFYLSKPIPLVKLPYNNNLMVLLFLC